MPVPPNKAAVVAPALVTQFMPEFSQVSVLEEPIMSAASPRLATFPLVMASDSRELVDPSVLALANLLLDYVLGTLLSSAALTHLKQLLSRIKYKEESAAPRLEALAPLVAPVLN